MSVDILPCVDNWSLPNIKYDNSSDDINLNDNSSDDINLNDNSSDDVNLNDDVSLFYGNKWGIRSLNLNDNINLKDNSSDDMNLSDNSSDDMNLNDSPKNNSTIKSFNKRLVNDSDKIDYNKGMWYNGMYIKNFNCYKITTTVMIVELNKFIDEEVIFHLLPITKMFLNKKRCSAKCKLPFCDIPGSIIALKHKDQVRGIVKSEKEGFKHSISIDISTSEKNVNVQLSSLKMKICGSASEDGKLGLEAADLVINHIENIQNMINKIKANKDIAEKTINWVIENIKGEKILRETITHNGRLTIYDQIEDFTIVYPKYFIPDELDINIAKFLLSLVNEFVYHSDMCEKINSMLNAPDVINDINDIPLKIHCMNFVMVNYNYHLLFDINLENLDKYIHGKNNFYSHYHDGLSKCVTIELAYDPIINASIKRKKNKVPRITFLCYKKGSVTHSGPGNNIMRESYYLFMITIAEIKHLIESK